MDRTDEELIDVAIRLPRKLVEAVLMNNAPLPVDPERRRIAMAKWILASRRRRCSILPRMILGEPTWEMIVDLYVTCAEGRRTDVSGLCHASGVAPTTALRYLNLLADAGLITRVEDEDDGRRAFLEISDALRSALAEWLDQAFKGLCISGLAVTRAVTPD